jgi:hypothetical protein
VAIGANDLVKLEFEKNSALFSNQSAHDCDPQTFVTYLDVMNDVAGRRSKRPGKGAAKGANAGFEISALHEFIRVDPTTGVTTQYIFRTFNTAIERWTGAAWANSPLPSTYGGVGSSAWVFKNFNNRVFATNGANHLVYFDGSTGPTDGREWYFVGVDAPAVAAGYSALTGTEYSTGTVAINNGSKNLVGTGTTWVAGDVGRSIDILGVRYTIASFISGVSLTLLEAYKGVNVSGAGYTIYRGIMDWSQPPQYTYCYKNSRTGHVSNPAPVTQVTEKDQVGRTITLTGIAYSAAAFQNGYDQIIIFRTPKNGATLVQIGNVAIPNLNSGASTTFTETATAPETYLDRDLLSTEVPKFNYRPVDGSGNPLFFSSLGEWSGRLFATAPRSSQLYFCGAPEEIPLGLPEECWPPKYTLRCVEPKGMVEVGTGSEDTDALIVHTSSGDRAIVGYDPLSFRLVRIQTRKSEGFQGGSTVVGGNLVELHRDKRLMDYGASKDLGRQIQDKLLACSASAFTKSRVTWFSYGDRDLLFVSVPKTSGSASNDGTFIYDYDLEQLCEWSIGFSAFATVHNTGTGEIELWAGTSAGQVFRLMDPTVFTDAGANFQPQFKTATWRPFGENGRGELQWIQIFTPEGGAFVGNVYLDEEPNLSDPDARGATFAVTLNETRTQSAKGKKRTWKPPKPVMFNALNLELIFPSTAAAIQIEKIIVAATRINEPEGLV